MVIDGRTVLDEMLARVQAKVLRHEPSFSMREIGAKDDHPTRRSARPPYRHVFG
jgi:hypothetical protein